MAGADEQQEAPGDEVDAQYDSTSSAVSQLFRDYNRMLVGYLTSRLRSEQEAIGSRHWSKYILSKWSIRGRMEFSFDCVIMAPRSKTGIPLVLIAVLISAIAGHAPARAGDILDRGISFHIAPSPLSDALIEFSTQSGLQVAAADADVSRVNSNTNVIANPLEVPDVTVTAARPPTDEELAGNSLSQFVVHHATVHYFNTGVTGNLARWRGGKQSICPATDGLNPAQNAYVTARLLALATYVGAPVDSAPQCKSNVQILFTDHPQEKMDAVIKWATVYFRNRYTGGMKDLIAFKGDRAIQGWYMTTRGGAIVLNTDVALVGLNVLPVWPQITQNYLASGSLGTRLGGGSESGSGIGIVFLVIDTRKLVNDTIGAMADYLAMMTLSLVQSPDHCDPLPSILDLMSSSCGARQLPAAMTAGDLAFLRALYYKNTGLGRSLSRSEIESNMLRQFKGH
jgi:hypothetical protein